MLSAAPCEPDRKYLRLSLRLSIAPRSAIARPASDSHTRALPPIRPCTRRTSRVGESTSRFQNTSSFRRRASISSACTVSCSGTSTSTGAPAESACLMTSRQRVVLPAPARPVMHVMPMPDPPCSSVKNP